MLMRGYDIPDPNAKLSVETPGCTVEFVPGSIEHWCELPEPDEVPVGTKLRCQTCGHAWRSEVYKTGWRPKNKRTVYSWCFAG